MYILFWNAKQVGQYHIFIEDTKQQAIEKAKEIKTEEKIYLAQVIGRIDISKICELRELELNPLIKEEEE